MTELFEMRGFNFLFLTLIIGRITLGEIKVGREGTDVLHQLMSPDANGSAKSPLGNHNRPALLHLRSELDQQKSPILACYFEYRLEPNIDHIGASMCTHILFIGSMDTNGTEPSFLFPNRTEIQYVMKLKKKNPKLKILLTLTPRNRAMSKIVKDAQLCEETARSVANFLETNSFDGFDVDWEFPVWMPDSQPTDKAGLNAWLKKLRSEFNSKSRRLLLSMAVAAPWDMVAKAYDVPVLNRYLDFINIMNYDFHDFAYEPITGYNAPLFPKRFEFWLLSRINTAYSTLNWQKSGMDRSKIVVGIPTYARGYTLLFGFWHTPYALATGPSKFGSSLSYSQVCKERKTGGYRKVWDDEAKVPYLYSSTSKQWFSYENPLSVAVKTKWIRQNKFAGAMVFDVHSDDWKSQCSNVSFPLLKTIRTYLL